MGLVGKVAQRLSEHKDKKIALITFGATSFSHPNLITLNLSPAGDISQAALNLFSMLREADESDADLIIAEHVPQHGLGAAIDYLEGLGMDAVVATSRCSTSRRASSRAAIHRVRFRSSMVPGLK